MNKERRRRINDIVGTIELLRNDLSEIRDEEEEAFDNLPENIQGGERGDKMEEYICLMDDADGTFDQLIDELNGITQ